MTISYTDLAGKLIQRRLDPVDALRWFNDGVSNAEIARRAKLSATAMRKCFARMGMPAQGSWDAKRRAA